MIVACRHTYYPSQISVKVVIRMITWMCDMKLMDELYSWKGSVNKI